MLSVFCSLLLSLSFTFLAADPVRPGISSGVADPATDSDWWGRVSRSLTALEYHASLQAGGLQAPNRSQNLRTWFRNDGITVVPRCGDPGWSWSWTTQSWGRSASARPVPPAAPVADASRVEYAREGLTEWYENRPAGLEQGFRITEPPPADGAEDPVVIRGAIGGTLCAAARESGRSIDFVRPDGACVLRYAELEVRDARGRALPASIDIADGLLTLRIDDAGALYPIVIDPVVSTPSWTHESNQGSAHFGHCVATAGDVNGDGYSDLIVGAPDFDAGQTDEGRTFVFHGAAGGLESDPGWMAEGNQAGAKYGDSVAGVGDVDGDGYDDVIVGAPYYDHGETDEGRAFLYRGSPTGLQTGIAWSDEGDQSSAEFGVSVAGAGDVNGDGYTDVVIGADRATHDHTEEGRVFVYYGSADGLSDAPSWSGESDNAQALFGRSVAGAGDVNGDGYADIIVGAPRYFDGHYADGGAFIYLGSADGMVGGPAWSTLGFLAYVESYGAAVAGAGDVNGDGYADVLVGAPDFTSDGGSPAQGRAVLFLGSSSGPASDPAWEIWGETVGDAYGTTVATAGDVNGDGYADVIIGAPHYDGATILGGKVYLYFGNWSGLGTTPAWTIPGDQDGAECGTSVTTAGDVNGDGFSDLAIGAEMYDNGQVDEGRAYVYHGSSDGPQMSAGWVTESNQADSQYGASVAPAGDVNGDGYGDVLVGAPAYDNGQENEGAAFLFMGGQSGLAALPAWYAEGNQADAWLGISVAGAGDVNGDGLEDVLVGAYGYDQTFTDEGAAFLWYGRSGSGPMGTPANADWQGVGGQIFASYGYCVARAGDVNGDGYGDVIVGAHNYSNGQSNEGAAFVYHGSATGLSGTANWFHDCDHDMAFYGQSVASAGDFNGDGYSDVIVGSPMYDHPTAGEGAASVYLGSVNGVRTGAPFWYAESNQENAMMGLSVASAGDVNGDGFSDVIIGSPAYDGAYTDGGRAFIWFGAATAPPTGTPDNANYWMGRPVTGANFGYCVASAGDVNGDGYSDVIVGAPFDEGTVARAGAAYLWLGGATSMPAGWYGQGTQANQDYGYRVASAGDVNGDGFSDIIVGSPIYDGGQNDEGRAFLYYGDQKRGVSRVPQQMQPGLARPIAPLGLSAERDRFALRAHGRTPAGRGVVRLVWEVKPFRTPFDGSGVARGAWANTGAPTSPGGSGIALDAIATNPPGGPLYRWRVRFESKNPLFPKSPWLYLSANGAGEADLRGDPANSDAPLDEGIAARMSVSSFPNPFRERTMISFVTEREEAVRITIHDPAGRLVRVLANGRLPVGRHTVTWDGRSSSGHAVGSGAYWIRLATGDMKATKQVVRVE